jgi:hypothetical protein
MREAIEQGLVLPENVFLVDKVQGKITSLGALIEEGLFDPMDGTYIESLLKVKDSCSNGFF